MDNLTPDEHCGDCFHERRSQRVEKVPENNMSVSLKRASILMWIIQDFLEYTWKKPNKQTKELLEDMFDTFIVILEEASAVNRKQDEILCTINKLKYKVTTQDKDLMA